MQIVVDSHPLLDLRAFVSLFPRPLGELSPPRSAEPPLQSDDQVREAIRALLRHGGFKPTGRSKPASEYLIKAAAANPLPVINPAVDLCNLVSLHSGLPVSVIDLDRARPPYRAALAPAGATYVFNASGQTIDIAGLLCLFDADGPCANAVKDAQRTKTHPGTVRTLSLLWGTNALPGRASITERWYRELLEREGARTETVVG